jgi:hypothetical protein
MAVLARDTSPEAERVLFELTRRQTPQERLLQVFALNRLGRELTLTGLKRRYPMASTEELRGRLAALLLGADLAKTIYGWEPRSGE